MPYEILEHTADIRIKVSGIDLEELFQSALQAMNEILNPKSTQSSSTTSLNLEAADSTVLLINFLSEILTFSHINKSSYSVKFTNLTETQLTAELTSTPTTEFAEDIKAVTFHEANITQNDEGNFETNIIFDI